MAYIKNNDNINYFRNNILIVTIAYLVRGNDFTQSIRNGLKCSDQNNELPEADSTISWKQRKLSIIGT